MATVAHAAARELADPTSETFLTGPGASCAWAPFEDEWVNLIDETQQPLLVKLGVFLAVMIPSVGLTLLTVLKSGPLAQLIDTLADERLDARAKLHEVRKLIGRPRTLKPLRGARSSRLQGRATAHRRFHAES